MKKIEMFCLFVCSAMLTTGLFAQEKQKVACIGNSITYGAFIANRAQNCYPAQLQTYLGDGYEVKNFGVSSRTLLSKGDFPYIKTEAFKESKSFLPDIVLIKLGTNDTKPQNWKYAYEFIDDYQSLIDAYSALSSHPRIILLTPIRCFLPDNSQIKAKLIEENVCPMIKELAKKNKLELINLFNIFSELWESELMPDKLHPSAIGSGEMAKYIYDYLADF